jgi:hypothetical protein
VTARHATAIGVHVKVPTMAIARWRIEHGNVTARRRRPPSVFPPP